MVTRRLLAVALTTFLLSGCGQDEQTPAARESAAPTSAAPTRSGTLSPSSTPSSSSDSPTEGQPTTTAGKGGKPRGGTVSPSSVQETNAAAVAAAYARTTLTIDTKLDSGRNDGQRRATRWMTPDLADRLAAGLPGSSGWDDLRKDDTWTKVAVTDITPAGGDPTKGLESERLLEATVSTHTKSGKKPSKSKTTMSVTLTRDGESKPWRVSGMQTY